MHKIKNKSVGMVLKVDSVSERRSRAFIPSPANQAQRWAELHFPHRGASAGARSLSRHAPRLLQEGVELSLNVVEGVFTHVVHLARFPALFPLLGGDLSRRRSRGRCRLLHRVLVKFILHDRVSERARERQNEYGAERALYKVWVSPSQPC